MRIARYATVALLGLGGAVASAQTPAPQTPPDAATPSSSPAVQPPPTARLPPRIGVNDAPPRPLTLDDAIRLTLAQNNDVAIARLEVERARQDVRAAIGVLDPRLQPNFLYQTTTSPVTSTIGGASNGSLDQTQWSSGGQLIGRSPFGGGSYRADLNATRLETTNTFQRLNPQFPSSAGFTFIQPLLRNRTLDADRRLVLINRTAVDLTDAQLERLLMDQLSLVEQAYWDLAFASRNVDVLMSALTQARRQVESNERQVAQGTLAPIDVVEAETQVATFYQDVATAQQALTEAENRLKVLMLTDRTSEMWNQALIPAEVSAQPAPALTLDAALTMALARRPELDEQIATVAQNTIERRFYTDQARPQVDVVARYGLSGLAGTIVEQSSDPIGTPTIPDFFTGGLGTSFGSIFDRRFPTISVQLQVDIPFGNRTARANLAKVGIVGEQLARSRDQLEQTIEAQVRNGLQAVVSSEARLRAAASAARNAQQQYDSEQRRFESGLGNVFLVLQRQTALVTAQAQEVRARADLNQAIGLFNRALGTTLEQHHVTFKPSTGHP